MAQMSPANTPVTPTTAALVVAEAARAQAAEAAKLDKSEASSTYARPRGNTFIFLGDSTTQGGTTASGDATVTTAGALPAAVGRGEEWAIYAAALSGGQINYLANAGVGGQTSTQMLARIQTDVIAKAPAYCTIMAGTNDITATPQATTQANIRSMIGLLKAAGIQPILCTILPCSTGIPANRKGLTTALNGWIRRYAAANQIPLLDFYAQMVDPATGSYLAAYNNDGTHPNGAGLAALGAYMASALASYLPKYTPMIALDNNDPSNLMLNGLMVTDANSDGIPDGWVLYTNPTTGTLTPSTVTDSALPGKGLRLTAAGPTTGICGYRGTRITTGFTVGDRIALAGVVTVSTGIPTVNIWCIFNGSTNGTNFIPIRLTQPVTRGMFYAEAVIPTGTTSMDYIIEIPAGSAGTFDLYQATHYNLTKLGIDPV